MVHLAFFFCTITSPNFFFCIITSLNFFFCIITSPNFFFCIIVAQRHFKLLLLLPGIKIASSTLSSVRRPQIRTVNSTRTMRHSVS